MIDQLLLLSRNAQGKFKAALPYGLPLKLILGALLTVLTGAGFLGYVSDYATYWYAMDTGVRTPLEGVPYLKAAVTFGSLFILFTSGVCFGISILIFRFIYGIVTTTPAFIKISFSIPFYFLKRQKSRKFLAYARYLKISMNSTMLEMRSESFAFKSGFILGITILFTVLSNFVDPSILGVSDQELQLIVFAYCTIAMSVMFFPSALWPFSFTLTILYFTACIYTLFQTEYYSHFLKTIGYGGGIPIKIVVKDELLRERLSAAEAALILRTNDVYIILDRKNKTYIEVPRDQTLYATYKVGAISYKE